MSPGVPPSHISVFIPIVPVMAGLTAAPVRGVKCLNGANDEAMTRHRERHMVTHGHMTGRYHLCWIKQPGMGHLCDIGDPDCVCVHCVIVRGW